MIYPRFIKEGDTIGICAPSAGVGNKLDDYLESIEVLKEQGYKIKETESVRKAKLRSANASKRSTELDELVKDKSVNMIMAAAGGDVQLEMLSKTNFDSIKENPKWVMGASDPTNLVFPITTMLDIATLYGFNGSSYKKGNDKDQNNNLEILKGNLIKQRSFLKYQEFIDKINDENNYKKVSWQSKKPLNIKGRCIGGCLDCIEKIIGTKYDNVSNFINKYKNDGIIWYFDNFAMSAFNVYLTFLQFRNAGWFKNCKGVLIGRVAFPNVEGSDLITSYEEAYKLGLRGIPYISEMDIGHTSPKMTMINGAIINVKYKDHKGSIDFKLK